MLTELTRRQVIEILALVATGKGSSDNGKATAKKESHDHHAEGEPTLNRFATSIIGSEITGIFITREGRFFFNVQHPDANLDGEDEPGIVGALSGLNITDLPEDFPSVQIPAGDDFDYADSGDGNPEPYDKMVQTALGSYQPMIQGGTDIGQGERLGVPQSPDGEFLSDGAMPDFNGYISAEGNNCDPEGVHEGYLFTNWETRPGLMSRIHIVSRGNGPWHLIDAQNVDFRNVQGTWVNCFGTVSPWGTPLTSEENYFIPDTAHWNDPNFDTVSDVETLARYLGYETNSNGIYDEEYPNPYRYGYITEIENPTSDDPTPVKHFTLGRSTHENAVVMPDQKTAYTTSDGTGKAFYKFIADEAGDLSSGTLYVAKAIQQGSVGGDPADVSFHLDWIELGHATNEEIESWIAEYDDVTQADYVKGETSYITDAQV